MPLLDPTDRDLAKKRAREAVDADLVGLDEYIKEHPTLDPSGYPADPISAAFEELFAARTLVDLFGGDASE